MNEQISKKLDLIIEGLVYIFIIFLFMDKGETFRVVGIYLPFFLLIIKFIILKESPVNLNNSVFNLVLILCLSGIIASVFAPSILYSLSWFKRTYLKLFLVSIVFFGLFKTQERITNLTYLLIIMTIVFTIFTFYDFYKKIIVLNMDYGTTIRKYISPLEVFLPFVFCLFVDNRKIFKYIGLIILILGTLAVVLTGSRGGWLSISASFIVCIYGYFYIKKPNLKILTLTICSFLLFIFMGLTILSPSYIKEKFVQLKKGYTSQRMEMVWPAAIDSYMNLPLINKIFGNGLGRMTYLEDFKKWYLKKFNHEPSEIYPPHNLYLSTLYKQGILGFIILIFLIFKAIKNLIRSIKLSQEFLNIKIFGISLLAVLIGIVIHSFVEDMFLQWVFIIPAIIGYINYTQNILNRNKIKNA